MTTQNQHTGCSAKAALPWKPRTISVNGVTIPRADIARETQNHPAAKPVEAMLAAARALVVRELLLQEARSLGIRPVPLEDEEGRRETDEEALVRLLVEQEVHVPKADEEACHRYHAQNRRRFRSAPIWEARHILIACAPGDAEAREKARAQAAALIRELMAEPQAFAVLADIHSACPSRTTGGNLGQIGPGQTVPEFECALAAMTPGAPHPQPVETRYGIHVVVLDQRVDGEDLPFEIVHDRIARWLEEKVRRTAIQQYISILAGRANIQGIDIAASSSPLVQ